MKNFFILSLITVLLFSCKNEIQKEKTELENTKTKTVKTYGILFPKRDSISVNLNLNNYKSYKEFLERVKQIDCSDRIPKITLENNEEIRKIYFQLNCDEKGKYELIKTKNVIEIYNDKIEDNFNDTYHPLDSLNNIISKNITNYGKIESLSESPDKLHFAIIYDLDSNPNQLKNTLLMLTKAFDEVGGNNVLRIMLEKKVSPKPKPKAKAKPKKVIEVIEDEEEVFEGVIESVETDEETVEVIIDDTEQEIIENIPFAAIVDAPIYKGCESYTSKTKRKSCSVNKIKNYINSNFNTTIASKNNITGVQKLYCVFTISSSGSIKDVRVRGSHPKLSSEAERAIKLIPKPLKPGFKNGKAVNVIYSLPLAFKF